MTNTVKTVCVSLAILATLAGNAQAACTPDIQHPFCKSNKSGFIAARVVRFGYNQFGYNTPKQDEVMINKAIAAKALNQ